jgi:hypothetical protein
VTLPLVVGIAGAKRSGKSTLAQLLCERHGYEQKSFAGPLKDAALALDPIVGYETSPVRFRYDPVRLSTLVNAIGWERAKDEYPEVRRTLQRLGTEVGRGFFGRDAWVDLAGPWPPMRPTLFADVRFDNEAAKIVTNRGIVIEVTRPGYERGSDGHASESGIDPRLLRGYAVNHGTPEDLYTNAMVLIG